MKPEPDLKKDNVPGFAAGDADAQSKTEKRPQSGLMSPGSPLTPNSMATLPSKGASSIGFMRILNDIVQKAESAPWRRTRDGAFLRPIWDDRSFLMKCEAGLQIRSHVHDSEELLVMLEGDLRIGEVHFSAGDFQVSPAGSEHPSAEALGDCLVLLQYAR